MDESPCRSLSPSAVAGQRGRVARPAVDGVSHGRVAWTDRAAADGTIPPSMIEVVLAARGIKRRLFREQSRSIAGQPGSAVGRLLAVDRKICAPRSTARPAPRSPDRLPGCTASLLRAGARACRCLAGTLRRARQPHKDSLGQHKTARAGTPTPACRQRPRPGASMKLHDVKVYPSKAKLPREDQLAWKIAAVAADQVAVERDVTDDDHQPHHRQRLRRHRRDQPPPGGLRARHGARPSAQGRRHRVRRRRRPSASARNGRPGRTAPRCASSTCTTPSSPPTTRHPGDNIPPILAVAQTMEKSGRDLIRGIATGYEIQIDLVRAICLHEHKIDHIAHLCPAQAAGIGTLLGLPAGDDLPGGAAGAACQLHHPPVAQGRDQLVEGLCARACRQAGGRGGRPRDARRGRAEPDLRRRGQRHRLDARTARDGALPRAAAGAGRAQARHPGQLHQGAQRRIPEPGADRPRVPDARADRRPRRRSRRSSSTPATTRTT